MPRTIDDTVHRSGDKPQDSVKVTLPAGHVAHLLDALPGCCPTCHRIGVAVVAGWIDHRRRGTS